ncbi:MAG TPA: hypothetical protein VHX14_06725, partial [Thermoanaerobaculia bacterium]|nr:hypothetical protein [Thermoanaerobaculia bacterium]
MNDARKRSITIPSAGQISRQTALRHPLTAALVFVVIAITHSAPAQQPSNRATSQQPTLATGQPANSSTPPATPPSVPGHFDGVASCANSGCHGSTQPLNAARVLQNEYYTWLSSDRHAQAYNVLFSDR